MTAVTFFGFHESRLSRKATFYITLFAFSVEEAKFGISILIWNVRLIHHAHLSLICILDPMHCVHIRSSLQIRRASFVGYLCYEFARSSAHVFAGRSATLVLHRRVECSSSLFRRRLNFHWVNSQYSSRYIIWTK